MDTKNGPPSKPGPPLSYPELGLVRLDAYAEATDAELGIIDAADVPLVNPLPLRTPDPHAKAHPLEPVALAAFKAHSAQDEMTLAIHFGGSSPAFVEVANHVLTSMLLGGKLRRDTDGMYRLRDEGPPVAQECYARRNCRAGLIGLVVVEVGDRFEREIASSRWDAGGVLMLRLEGDDCYVPASGYRLVSKWKATCCRPSRKRLEEALADPGKEGVGG